MAYLFSKSLGVASWGFVTFSLKSAGRCGDGVPGEPPAGELVWKAGEKAGAGPGAEARAADGLTHTRQDHWPCDESLQRKCSPGGGPVTVLTHCFLPVYRTGLLYRLLN